MNMLSPRACLFPGILEQQVRDICKTLEGIFLANCFSVSWVPLKGTLEWILDIHVEACKLDTKPARVP